MAGALAATLDHEDGPELKDGAGIYLVLCDLLELDL